MHALSLSFNLLTCCGYWRPIKWSLDPLKYWVYNAYSIFMILLLCSFGVCVFVDSIVSTDLTRMIDKFSICISVFGVCCKVTNLFVRREEIISVIKSLEEGTCAPRDWSEEIIRNKFERQARNLTIYCEILNQTAVFLMTFAQYPMLLKTGTLPVADWVPYVVSSYTVFVITMLHQTFGLIFCVNAGVGHETLISGLMIQTCSLLEIFCHRVQSLSSLLMKARQCSKSDRDLKNQEKEIISDLVQFHNDIYKFALSVNIAFTYMILIQFSASSTVLCMCVYKMSTRKLLTVDFFFDLMYLVCMLMQIYLYCWFGNEVTLKSIDVSSAVYEMDWTDVPVNVTKDLWMIMARSTKPIKMTSGYVIILSAESFMSVIKLSYSSYNLLKDSSTS